MHQSCLKNESSVFTMRIEDSPLYILYLMTSAINYRKECNKSHGDKPLLMKSYVS